MEEELNNACVEGDLEEVKRLIRRGIDVNCQYHHTASTPLICASARGIIEVVELLLKNGANVNHKRKDGRTALHFASMPKSDMEIVYKLIEYGANPYSTDNKGITPMDIVDNKEYVLDYISSIQGLNIKG